MYDDETLVRILPIHPSFPPSFPPFLLEKLLHHGRHEEGHAEAHEDDQAQVGAGPFLDIFLSGVGVESGEEA